MKKANKLANSKKLIKQLPTWSGASVFQYSISILGLTEIHYGNIKKNSPINIKSEHFNALLENLKGKEIKVGTSKTNPPKGSLGAWLQKNVSQTVTASYVAPILIEEGFAERVEDTASIKIL